MKLVRDENFVSTREIPVEREIPSRKIGFFPINNIEEEKIEYEKEAHRGMKNNHNSCNIRFPIAKRRERRGILFAILLLVVCQRVSEFYEICLQAKFPP